MADGEMAWKINYCKIQAPIKTISIRLQCIFHESPEEPATMGPLTTTHLFLTLMSASQGGRKEGSLTGKNVDYSFDEYVVEVRMVLLAIVHISKELHFSSLQLSASAQTLLLPPSLTQWL